MADKKAQGVLQVDVSQLELPQDLLDELEEIIQKSVRTAVMKAGERWTDVVWRDHHGGTRGIIGYPPEYR
ncbi:MAG: hypothetical protein AAF218_00235 [Pseudomonadota bacterium]